MQKKLCFLIGHRETDAALYDVLYREIERHIREMGVTDFLVGHYGGFDRLAVRVLQNIRQRYPQTRLFLLLPYHPAGQPVEIPAGFAGSWYPPGMEKVPRRYAIVRANRCAVERAQYLIAGVWHPASNAQKLVEYARRRERKGKIAVTVLHDPNAGC